MIQNETVETVLLHHILFTINLNKLPYFVTNHSAGKNATCSSITCWCGFMAVIGVLFKSKWALCSRGWHLRSKCAGIICLPVISFKILGVDT